MIVERDNYAILKWGNDIIKPLEKIKNEGKIVKLMSIFVSNVIFGLILLKLSWWLITNNYTIGTN